MGTGCFMAAWDAPSAGLHCGIMICRGLMSQFYGETKSQAHTIGQPPGATSEKGDSLTCAIQASLFSSLCSDIFSNLPRH